MTGIRPFGINVVLILSSWPLAVSSFFQPFHVLMRIRNDEDKQRLKTTNRLVEDAKLQRELIRNDNYHGKGQNRAESSTESNGFVRKKLIDGYVSSTPQLNSPFNAIHAINDAPKTNRKCVIIVVVVIVGLALEMVIIAKTITSVSDIEENKLMMGYNLIQSDLKSKEIPPEYREYIWHYYQTVWETTHGLLWHGLMPMINEKAVVFAVDIFIALVRLFGSALYDKILVFKLEEQFTENPEGCLFVRSHLVNLQSPWPELVEAAQPESIHMLSVAAEPENQQAGTYHARGSGWSESRKQEDWRSSLGPAARRSKAQ
jgi:hypothetical protein